MPKISDLDYVSEIDATSYLLGVKGGSTVRFPASVLQGEAPVVNTTFISQGDTPTSYVGQTGKLAAVNAAEDALEFIAPPTSLPVGGTTGQVLTKQSATDGDAGWDDPSGGTEIAAGTTPPANPVDGQLWIDEAQGMQDQTNFTDVSNFTTDYPLRRGETAVVKYSGATSVPLHIKTVEGVYEIYITGDGSATASNNNNGTYLNPNGTTYSSAFSRVGYYSLSTNTGGQGVSTESNFYTGAAGIALKSRMVANTTTKAKTIEFSAIGKRTSDLLNENGNIYWIDVTTVWASLGTITLPFAQSGTILIRRLY